MKNFINYNLFMLENVKLEKIILSNKNLKMVKNNLKIAY